VEFLCYFRKKDLNSMTENIDYYIENGNLVFTAHYHRLRGYCCGSGCRHCVYRRPDILQNLPDFALTADHFLVALSRKYHIHTFHQAVQYVALLPYRRNQNAAEMGCIFGENCGTCSTKHAALRALAVAHNYPDIQLHIGIYKMNAQNTPAVQPVLALHPRLPYLPEAHCYLSYDGQIFDFTNNNSYDNLAFANDLLCQISLDAHEIATEKVKLHRNYLSAWLIEQNIAHNDYTLEAVWAIREACIAALAAA
jgi:hypothetical protein